MGRSNYTLHKSIDSGASWQFVNRIYGGGSGYSDAHVLPDGDAKVLAMVFQKTFDPPVKAIEGGGYDVGLALMALTEGSDHQEKLRNDVASLVFIELSND